MNWGLFFSLLFAVLAFAMLFSGFWAREELSPEWRQAKAIGFVVIGIGGLLAIAGVLGPDFDVVTGGIWLAVCAYGLSSYGADLRGRPSRDGAAPGPQKTMSEVASTRWDSTLWTLWVPTAVVVIAMAVGVVLVALK